jgi:hypothetical protein
MRTRDNRSILPLLLVPVLAVLNLTVFVPVQLKIAPKVPDIFDHY